MNNDRDFLDLMIKQAKLMEYALEESIRQFDYNNNAEWRRDFKGMMIKHASDRLKKEESEH
jgi:hypothetical protein